MNARGSFENTMVERAASKKGLELVKSNEQRTSSGVVPAGVDPSVSMGIATGVVLDGKYLVGRIVGAGAVGIVFEAQNLELDEKVAIKCLRPEMLVDTAMVARFAREAKAAAAIKSEYVATVYDVGTSPDGIPYIVMEYLDGKDLGQLVQEQGTLGARTAVEYALQVCEALAVAHSKGIVHRDIKPENLLLTERAGGMRIIKVLDFGISKAALTGSIFRDELPLVKTVNLMGTPLYMSPEQVRCSDGVDVRSDIWSLGMVIYEVMTGETAFAGTSITEICAAILESKPKPIELHRNDLPSGLVDVVNKCLEKDVNRRYQNVAELALALMPFGPKRTRLNVERAVAVLQAAGQLDPKVTVNSTMPPPTSDAMSVSLNTPFPLPPGVPSSPSTNPGLAMPSSAPSLPEEASEPSARGRKIVLGLVIVATIVALASATSMILGRNATPEPPPTAAKNAPTATETPTATTPATTAAPTPPPPPETATAHATATTAVVSKPATPPAGTAPPAAFRPVATPMGKPLPAPPRASGKAPGTAKPDEPDLGY